MTQEMTPREQAKAKAAATRKQSHAKAAAVRAQYSPISPTKRPPHQAIASGDAPACRKPELENLDLEDEGQFANLIQRMAAASDRPILILVLVELASAGIAP